ncbi:MULTISPECIES: DUF6706 family protein [unclassified Spirosoma]|uniref:DUF6706 family protein n=1 Tax=unclassified Spirosoma TaxID=2621999 RepID=UPI00095C626C|nr:MULTISPECIES: DUF6706 family protein [unclassified Spirosoma]MBN8821277.1 hypothetical protein [Spirosoma sp.]OJW78066.1 MAG: hypothetical protein BGO59_29040 [Spirosoma sp. 48-14]
MATLQQYIADELSAYSQTVTDVQLELYLAEGNMLISDPATKSNRKSALLYVLVAMLPKIPKTVSEGGFSVSWNQDAIAAYCRQLASETGIVMPSLGGPSVSDKSYLW